MLLLLDNKMWYESCVLFWCLWKHFIIDEKFDEENPWLYTVSEKDCTIFFLGAQCVESGVSCTDCY